MKGKKSKINLARITEFEILGLITDFCSVFFCPRFAIFPSKWVYRPWRLGICNFAKTLCAEVARWLRTLSTRLFYWFSERKAAAAASECVCRQTTMTRGSFAFAPLGQGWCIIIVGLLSPKGCAASSPRLYIPAPTLRMRVVSSPDDHNIYLIYARRSRFDCRVMSKLDANVAFEFLIVPSRKIGRATWERCCEPLFAFCSLCALKKCRVLHAERYYIRPANDAAW